MPGGVLEGVSVLVVEDHAASARMIAALLAAAGAQVELAESVAAAQELLDRVLPRVLVVDLVLAETGGLALVSALKANPTTRDIVCIAMTVLNGGDCERAAYDAGCAAYVRKPVDVDTFANLLAKHLEGE